MGVPVPRPRPVEWNGQSWVADALRVLEREGFLERAEGLVELVREVVARYCSGDGDEDGEDLGYVTASDGEADGVEGLGARGADPLG